MFGFNKKKISDKHIATSLDKLEFQVDFLFEINSRREHLFIGREELAILKYDSGLKQYHIDDLKSIKKSIDFTYGFTGLRIYKKIDLNLVFLNGISQLKFRVVDGEIALESLKQINQICNLLTGKNNRVEVLNR